MEWFNRVRQSLFKPRPPAVFVGVGTCCLDILYKDIAPEIRGYLRTQSETHGGDKFTLPPEDYDRLKAELEERGFESSAAPGGSLPNILHGIRGNPNTIVVLGTALGKDDAGQRVRKLAAEVGIELVVREACKTPVNLVIADGEGGRWIVKKEVASDGEPDLPPLQTVLDKAAELTIERPFVLVMGALLQRKTSEVFDNLIDTCKRQKLNFAFMLPTSLETLQKHREKVEQAISRADWSFGNADEINRKCIPTSASPPTGEGVKESIWLAVSWIEKALNLRAADGRSAPFGLGAMVTDGINPTVSVRPGREHYIHPVSGVSKDFLEQGLTVGCGDSTIGRFFCDLSLGHTIRDALQHAIHYASAIATFKEATPPHDAVRARVAEIRDHRRKVAAWPHPRHDRTAHSHSHSHPHPG